LLRSVREQSGLSLFDAASRAGLDIEELADLERGDTEVNLDLPVGTAISWISAVSADGDLALTALRRSLNVARNDNLSLAAGSLDRPKTIDEYVEEVASALDPVERESQ
jgi:transcriptional regulator with XRE-family HTH domain